MHEKIRFWDILSSVFSMPREQVEPLNRFSRIVAQTTQYGPSVCLMYGYNS